MSLIALAIEDRRVARIVLRGTVLPVTQRRPPLPRARAARGFSLHSAYTAFPVRSCLWVVWTSAALDCEPIDRVNSGVRVVARSPRPHFSR